MCDTMLVPCIGCSGYSPTTAEDDRPCFQDKDDDAMGGEHKSKPTAVITRDKPELCRPAGDWPQHWGDPVHEDDGGADDVGTSPQNGTEILGKLLAKLSAKDGI